MPSEPDHREGPVLRAHGLVKEFPGVRALDGVSIDLAPGSVHALVGENGAGKSTLIKILTGASAPDAGTVVYAGEERRFGSPLAAQRAGIAAIYQEVELLPLLSVARNLALGREPTRFGLIDFARMNAAAAEALAGYGIRVDVRRPLGELSVGTRQMVALARATAAGARVVVMDEPTSSLEPREVETLFAAIDGLRERGVAVVYVSHRLDELYRVCDTVTVLRDGRVVHAGPLAGTDRLRLVAHMLGRDPERVRSEGATTFNGGHRAVEGAPVLEASGLTVRHRIAGVDAAIRPGEVVALGGLLGSGRTETAQAIAGALPRDAGRVAVAGVPVRGGSTRAALRAGVALLPEDRKHEGIVPGLSVRENIALAAMPRLSRLGLVSERRIDRITAAFTERLRIKAAGPWQKVEELSGGNQQKVLLARWLAVNPRVLLLDEPTRGIDVGAKAEVQRLVEELAGEGLGVLLISSDLEELVEGADRVIVLKDGAVVDELHGGAITEDGLMAAIAAAGAPDSAPDAPDGGPQGAGAPEGPAPPGVRGGPGQHGTAAEEAGR